MSLFRGNALTLINLKVRQLVESNHYLTKAVHDALLNHERNSFILLHCYNYNSNLTTDHSRIRSIEKSSCNCALCRKTKEYVRLKRQLQWFKSETGSHFESDYAHHKSTGGVLSEMEFYLNRVSEMEIQIKETKREKNILEETINEFMKL